jgi:hypothetical protein
MQPHKRETIYDSKHSPFGTLKEKRMVIGTFRVLAAEAWHATGVQVLPYQVIYVRQKDPAQTWVTNPDKNPTDANGFKYLGDGGIAQDGSLVVGVPFGGLVGMIGDARAAFIGTNGSVAASSSGGELNLAANDELGYSPSRQGYHDNSGYIDFEVST